jgi:general nucleoside transport system ATP-binding protein
MSIAVAAQGIHKHFGPIPANAGASVSVETGEIHAVVGENGAGKSTLMRILAGMYAPDEGSVQVNGRDVTGWSTREAIEAGVGMVHQHFMLVPTLTVAENVVLGHEPKKGIRLDRATAVQKVNEIAARSRLSVPAEKLVSELTVGEAQRVEIVKTLYRGARILILDEPTAVLSPPEVQDLWQVLRQLRADGGTIVVITHKLDEVMELSDRVTVMRQGRTVTTVNTRDTSPAELARAMVGRDVALAARGGGGGVGVGDVALALRDVRVKKRDGTTALDGINLELRRGEILGIAGVEGNGQTELIEVIAGLLQVSGGDLKLFGQTPIHENAVEKVENFDIRPPRPEGTAGTLSGGNQQKIVIARELTREHSVLLAAQPTRGVDVGAIEAIHARLRAERDAGKAVLLVSADLNEILALSDRIAVLYRGRIAATLSREEADQERLGAYMTGAATVGTA